MNDEEALATALGVNLLAAAGALTAAIHDGVVARGYTDLRPAHGFAFARMAAGGATVTELAAHLGVTRQAAGQLVDELVAKGYAERRPHPDDARARLVVLTGRGHDCTRAAEAAAADAVRPWTGVLGRDRLRALAEDLHRVAPNGPVRPTW
ncbi:MULTISPECIES: MarR family winged helix-turn-helix transcriptional regulator [unclassified Streptomyces]|uniref:MarR family winged helix-turn-helix transcriptional regulator n=1 Tax=unclassified Streptomyces TaxID=2593676 RepID=UPI003802A584